MKKMFLALLGALTMLSALQAAGITNTKPGLFSSQPPMKFRAVESTLIEEGFEGDVVPPANWTIIDGDYDGISWRYDPVFTFHGGSRAISSDSYVNGYGALTPDNFLITPALAIPANSTANINYWICAQDEGYAFEHYAVVLSTTGISPSDFTTTLFEETFQDKANKGPGIWHERNVTIPATYAGQTVFIAFRHYNSTNNYAITLDDVKITAGDVIQDTSAPTTSIPTGTAVGANCPMTVHTIVSDETGIASVVGHYQIDGQTTWADFVMTPDKNITGSYSGTIPPQPAGTTGLVKFTTTDTFVPANSGDSPSSVFEFADNAEMISVNGGTFIMGDSIQAQASAAHPVTLSSFFIGKYEVTQAEWLAIMESNPSVNAGNLKKPVDNISWYDALVYCNKRSLAENLTPCYTISNSTNPADWGNVPTSVNSTWNAATCNWSAKGYRLPTEAEWEFAARGGNYSNGFMFPGSDNSDSVGWTLLIAGSSTHPVGKKAPNELGIYDMTGNVWEWNWDWSDGYYSPEAQTNPTGAVSSSYNGRSNRGSSYMAHNFYARVYDRNWWQPQGKGKFSGLRLASSLDVTAIGENNLQLSSTLAQNYPNPFNPLTTINFSIKEAGNVKLVVMNAKGETVATLMNNSIAAGIHSVNFDGSGFNSGVYFYQLKTANSSVTKKMLLVK